MVFCAVPKIGLQLRGYQTLFSNIRKSDLQATYLPSSCFLRFKSFLAEAVRNPMVLGHARPIRMGVPCRIARAEL